MDFLHKATLLEQTLNMEIGEQVKKLATYTFSNFIRCPEVQQAIASGEIRNDMPHLRFVYIFYLFKKIQDFIGDTEVFGIYEKVMGVERANSAKLVDVVQACTEMRPHIQAQICEHIERLTRGQGGNVLWEVLRDGVISSSKLLKFVKQQTPDSKIFNPIPIQKNHYVASPVAFGVRNETVVKKLISELVVEEGIGCVTEFGFMLSPNDGIFGVSLDMCTNASMSDHNTVEFTSTTTIYEIKCRYKYLFSKCDYDPIYQAYQKLYNSPGRQELIDFIQSIQKPTVEYVSRGRLPTQNDYLLSFDRSWDFGPPKRKRKLTSGHKITEQCMKYNCYTESKVIILTDPALTSGKIEVKGSFFVDIYINPRHAYYHQCMLQYKIVTNYVQLTKGDSCKHTHPGVFLVSAFFRKRNSADFPKTYIKTERSFVDASVEIPVLLIITPVFVPHGPLVDTLEQAIKFWQVAVKEEFNHWPWAPTSLSAVGDVTP
ncbi:ORF37 [Alcelaphine gammaherpesvirus 1]|nr:ORF37 [Alcelaphine gammaherpesvirus 1]